MAKNEILYRPCKKCKSDEYDNADVKDMPETKDGRLIYEPESCDQCNFELKTSPSDLLH